jgi:hypothetical protein
VPWSPLIASIQEKGVRISIIISAMLLAFGVWGGVSSSQDLKFTDSPSPDPPPAPAPAMGDPVHGATCTKPRALAAIRWTPTESAPLTAAWSDASPERRLATITRLA